MIALAPKGLTDRHCQPRTLTAIGFDQPFSEPAFESRRLAPSMRLQAVRRRGRLIDFVWVFASDAAARLLHHSPHALQGQRLGALPELVPPGQPALIDRYRRILEQGRTQSFDHVHWVEGRQEVVIHRVVCEGDSVAVTLTNLNANRRAQAARLRAEAARASARWNP